MKNWTKFLAGLLIAAVTVTAIAQSSGSGPHSPAPAGTAALPGFWFYGDRNTGAYSPGADQFGISTGGVSRFTIDASGDSFFTGNVRLSIAAATITPALSILNSNALGIPTFFLGEDSSTKFGALQYVNSGNTGLGDYAPANGLVLYSYSGATGGLTLRADATGAGISMLSSSDLVPDFQIKADGTVLIGTTTDTGDKLTVNGATGITGNLVVDTSTLFVDSVNNQVFINGTADPISAGQIHLVVAGNAAQPQGNLLVDGTNSSILWRATSAAANKKIWQAAEGVSSWTLKTLTDTGGAGKDAISFTRGTTTDISTIAIGNSTDTPSVTVNGTTVDGTLTVNGSGIASLYSAQPILHLYENDQAANEKRWVMRATGKTFQILAGDDAFSSTKQVFASARGTGTALATITIGNSTDKAPVSNFGSFTIDSGAGSNALITEGGVDVNSGSNTTFNFQNSGAGIMTLQVDGVNLANPRTFTATYNPASLAANTTRTDSVTVNGITTTGGAVTANPGSDFTTSCVIASVRASATNTVAVTLRNTVDAVTACDEPSSTWTFTQAQ